MYYVIITETMCCLIPGAPPDPTDEDPPMVDYYLGAPV